MSGRERGKGKGNKSPRRSPINNRRVLTGKNKKVPPKMVASVLGLNPRDYRKGRAGEINIRRNAQRKVRETIERLQTAESSQNQLWTQQPPVQPSDEPMDGRTKKRELDQFDEQGKQIPKRIKRNNNPQLIRNILKNLQDEAQQNQ